MFAKMSLLIGAGTLLAAAWLSTSAAAGLIDDDARIASLPVDAEAASTVRLYWPSGPGPHPVLLYYRDSAAPISDADHIDAARALSVSADAVVVAVCLSGDPAGDPAGDLSGDLAGDAALAGRRAGEAIQWVLANASGLGGDPQRITVMAAPRLPPAGAQFQDVAWPPAAGVRPVGKICD